MGSVANVSTAASVLAKHARGVRSSTLRRANLDSWAVAMELVESREDDLAEQLAE
jgi:hypothetical protein